MSERLKRSIVKGFAAGCVNLCVVVPVGQIVEPLSVTPSYVLWFQLTFGMACMAMFVAGWTQDD